MGIYLFGDKPVKIIYCYIFQSDTCSFPWNEILGNLFHLEQNFQNRDDQSKRE